jgi:hypothetical protein
MLQQQKEHLTAALGSCVDSDYYSSLQQVSTTAFDAANRWTDNIFVGRSYMENKLGVEKTTINTSASARSPGCCVLVSPVQEPFRWPVDIICLPCCRLVLAEFIKTPAELDYMPE